MTTDTILTLIRHGQSQAQVDGILSRHDECAGLSQVGRQQAVRLAERLASTEELSYVTAVYTSVLERAKETATLIAPALPDLSPVADCGWCEMHAPEAEGLPWADVRNRFPYKGFPGNPYSRHIPRWLV